LKLVNMALPLGSDIVSIVFGMVICRLVIHQTNSSSSMPPLGSTKITNN